MQKVIDFLKANPTFFLATVEGDQPRVRPFGAVCGFEGKLYLITSNQKDVYRQLEANPKLELCGADANGNWLRVAATAAMDDRTEAKAAMLDDNPALASIYSMDDGKMAIFFLKDAKATFSSFTAAPETITF